LKILIQGTPGSGKNVIAAYLADKYGITHINYRKIVLSSIKRKTSAGKEIQKLQINHDIFPPKTAFRILEEYVKTNNINDFVLEGYPKTQEEAKLLADFLKPNEETYTFYIDTPKELTLKRLENRLICPTCSYTVYNFNPSNILEVECMNCHIPLTRRSDDNNKDILKRIERIESEKKGITLELRKISDTFSIEGSGSISKIICAIIDRISCDTEENIAEKGALLLVEGLGLNLADPNIIGTPRRIVKSLKG